MFRRKDLLKQLDEDIRDHIERETLENIEKGMPAEEARYAAIRKFGNVEQIKEQTREVWTIVALEQLLQDLRYGLRMLRRDPGFTATAILTLGLGIGVTTGIFSVINTVLLKPLPYPDADRIVVFSAGNALGEHFKSGVDGADFAAWRDHTQSFDQMAAYNYADETIAARGTASRVRVASVAGDFWNVTGAQTSVGRLFQLGREQDFMVLSYSLFKREFGGDAGIVGKVVTLDGRPVTVTGVLARDFRFLFPQDWQPGLANSEVGAFVSAPPLVRSNPWRVAVIARLKPQIPLQGALSELRGIEGAILKDHPDRWFPGISRMGLIPLQQKLAGASRSALFILQMAGFFVLLIACANIANLLLARGAARVREVAIRAAIGAGAFRMLRQFLTEGILVALSATAVGLLIAKWSIAMMIRFGPASLPRLTETAIDWRVLSFALALAVACGIVFSFGPAISLWSATKRAPLSEHARVSSAGKGTLRARRLLVAAELALSVILLIGAGLMLKSFRVMSVMPPGFAPANTLILKVSLSGPLYADPAHQAMYFKELLQRVGSLPGIQAYGIANVQDYLLQSTKNQSVNSINQFRESLVSPGYFRAVGMRLLKGEWIKDGDAPDTTIINEAMAQRVFGDSNPIGRRIDGLGRPVRVVGVADNLKYSKRDAEPGPEIFRPYPRNLWNGSTKMTVAARLPGDPLRIASAARKEIAGIDPTQTVDEVETLEDELEDSVAPRRFNLFILGTFAVAASLMAIVGIYGVVAYSVTQRTHEIGIRMALGAQRTEVVRMVLTQGMAAALAGIAMGLGGAVGLTRLMAGLLYEVAPNDPATFAAAALAFAVIAFLATGGPALKAALLDPLVALRYE